MDQHSADVGVTVSPEFKSVESGVKALWERVKRASEVIAELRNEKRVLQLRVEQLERELVEVRAELARIEEGVKSASGGRAQGVKLGSMYSNGEREVIMARVRELLAKLDAYL